MKGMDDRLLTKELEYSENRTQVLFSLWLHGLSFRNDHNNFYNHPFPLIKLLIIP